MADDSRGKQPGRLARYLASAKNILGCILGAGGLVLAFTGIVPFPLWLLVVGALYGIGALVAPAGRASDVLRGGFDPRQVVDALAELQKEMRGRVPPDIDAKVRAITAKIQSVLPKARRLSGGSQHLFVLQRTATDYLPTTVHAYLDLPREYAETKPVDGKRTAHQIVSDQLDVLSKQMDEVVDAANRGDVDTLLAQQRFLDEKFGQEALSIEGPSASATTQPGLAAPQPAQTTPPVQSTPAAQEPRAKEPPISQL